MHKTKEYIFHMFVTCFSQVPLPTLSTADVQCVCRAWPWKSLVLAVHFYFICAQPLQLFVSTEQPCLKISTKWNTVSQIPSYILHIYTVQYSYESLLILFYSFQRTYVHWVRTTETTYRESNTLQIHTLLVCAATWVLSSRGLNFLQLNSSFLLQIQKK